MVEESNGRGDRIRAARSRGPEVQANGPLTPEPGSTIDIDLTGVAPKVHQILNNNVVVSLDEGKSERILMGRGLGFKLRRGDKVDVSKVEKTFVLDVGKRGAWERDLLGDTPYEVIAAATAGVEAAEIEMGRSLGRSILIAVIDHLQFLLQRLDQGLPIVSTMMPELRILYPDEWRAGTTMLNAMKTSLGQEIPDEEHVFLAMHILNATQAEPAANTSLLFTRVHQVVEVVEDALQRSHQTVPDRTSADYARFVMHVRFMIQRMSEGAMLKGDNSALFDVASKSYPTSHTMALRVNDMAERDWSVTLTEEELLYLIVHIERLSHVKSK